MLSTELLTIILSSIAVLAVLWCAWRVAASETAVSKACEYVYRQNKQSMGLKRIAEIEASLTELTDAYEALLASQKKLRARIGMRENRADKTPSEPQIPDSATDPAGYKRAMRLKMQAGNLK